MTSSGATIVLAKASAYDNRTVTEQQALSWAQALDGIEVTEAVKAVVEHYAASTEFVRPGHIRALVKARRADALSRRVEPVPSPDLTGAEYAEALAAHRRSVIESGPVRHALGGSR